MGNKIILIIWCLANIALFWKTYNNYKTNPEYYYLRELLGHGLLVSRASASVLNLSCGLILIPVCRTLNSLIHLIFCSIARTLLTFWLQNIQNIHFILAITIIIASLVHSAGHIMNAINASRNYNSEYKGINWAAYKGQNPSILILTSLSGSTGILMLIILLTMAPLSIHWIREKNYNLFSAVHCLYVPFFCLFLVHPFSSVLKKQINTLDHIPGCSTSHSCSSKPIFYPIPLQAWIWVLPSLIISTLDMIYRTVMRNKINFKVLRFEQFSTDAIKLTLVSNKMIKLLPAQYILLHCPQISRVEWHPFSVISCCTYNCYTEMTLLIRTCGDWTGALSMYLTDNESTKENSGWKSLSIKQSIPLSHSSNTLKFLVDGGFCSPLTSILKSKVVICIAGGIGITPFCSIFSHLMKERMMHKRPYRIHLLWVVTRFEHLTWIENVLAEFHDENWKHNSPDRLEFLFYITKETCYKLPIFENNSIFAQRVYFQRPNWKAVFSVWANIYRSAQVPVFMCGPYRLMNDVEEECVNFNQSGCSFQCVRESFS